MTISNLFLVETSGISGKNFSNFKKVENQNLFCRYSIYIILPSFSLQDIQI